MDILNEVPEKKKPKRIVWLILIPIVILVLLFQFVDFAPRSPKETRPATRDSVQEKAKDSIPLK